MSKVSNYLVRVVLLVMLWWISAPSTAEQGPVMVCQVKGSDDQFLVYPRQKVFNSETFMIYQLIDGMTLLAINRQTLRFNRLSNLNLLPQSTLDPSWPPEPIQFFSGTCKVAD